MKTSVLISGAGPTGLTLALQLSILGIDYIIIDKKDGITKLTKAIGIQARTLELYDDIGVVKEFLKLGKINESGQIIVKGKVKGSINLKELGTGLSPYPYLFSLTQDKTETVLYNKIKELGGDVSWNTEMVDFDDSSDGVTAVVKDSKGAETKIESRYLVGCDGASSFVRKHLGLDFGGSTFMRYFYVIDAKVESQINMDHNFNACITSGSFCMFIPLPGDRFRIIGSLPAGYDEPEEMTLEKILERVDIDSGLGADISDIGWHSTYKVHSRKVDRFRDGNCFVAGDAAHVHSPAGGQGMNTGIQDAYNLAWKLSMVLKNQANDAVLDSYNQEREKVAQNLLSSTDRAFYLIAGENPILGMLRVRVLPLISQLAFNSRIIKKRFFPIMSQTGISYSDSDLNIKSSINKIKSGDRFPYWTTENGESIYELLKNNNWKIITNSEVDVELPDWVETKSVSELPEHIFGALSDCYILVRPDNHISYIGTDLEQVTTLINSIAT